MEGEEKPVEKKAQVPSPESYSQGFNNWDLFSPKQYSHSTNTFQHIRMYTTNTFQHIHMYRWELFFDLKVCVQSLCLSKQLMAQNYPIPQLLLLL